MWENKDGLKVLSGSGRSSLSSLAKHSHGTRAVMSQTGHVGSVTALGPLL